jgi:hypothetical protein
MPELSQNLLTTGHYIVSEASDMYRSREQIIVGSGAGILVAGAVMAQQTADGKFYPVDPAASDGTEVASAVLYEGCDATSADVRRVITARDTAVHADQLQWAAAVTDPQKTAALAELEQLGIIGR